MPGSKTETLALAGALGGGIAALLLLWIQKRRKDDVGAIPVIKLPAGSWFSIQALFKLGKDNFGYGTGRLILQAIDPSIGIGSLFIFGQKFILLRDPELVQEVLQKNHQAGGDYGKSFKGSPFDGLTDKTFGRGLFFAEDQDPQWAVAHKILTRPFSHRGILNMVPLMCEQADALVVALECQMRAGESVHMYDYLVKMALETIAVCSMGTHFDSFNSSEPHPFPVAFQATLDAMFNLLNVPTQLWSCCVLTMWRMQKAVGVMNGLIDEIVRKRVDKETSSSGKAPDLLDLMLAEGSKLSRENVRSQILTFLFAGHDSTAAAMSSLIVFLVANPRVEARLVAEIQAVVGSGEVQAHHIPELTYVDWCLKETLRLLPPAGNYQRMAFQDAMLGGKWKVKQYAPILVDVFALHMDPETWGADAACFVPERWEKGPPHAYSFMPFASGPRGCIGKEFSLMEQKIVAVKLLQRFTMRSPTAWTAREGSVLIKASESLPHTILGIDAEFSPQQFFAGASIPVQLQLRPLPCSLGCASSALQPSAAAAHSHGGTVLWYLCLRGFLFRSSCKKMGRMYGKGKGIATSAIPYRRSAPSWMKMKTEDICDHICKLAKKGLTPSQIGVTLRDSFGVPMVKNVTGSHILRILKTNGMAPSLPEDLYYLIKKAVSVRKHLDKNRKDHDSKFRLILVESRIHRLARYYKRVKSLPATWKYVSATASALVA